MATTQIAVRIDDTLLSAIDALVAATTVSSRAEAVRAGLAMYIEAVHQEQIDAAIVSGYSAHPPTAIEDSAAFASLADAIREEPW